MARETLTPVDAAWLHMEDPTNLMMVTGIMTFDGKPDMEHLLAIVRYRLLKYDRFRQRVVEPSLPIGSPHWETDPDFDVRAHVHRVALPAPGDQATLQEFVSDMMSTPLDFSKPLWQFHVIDNYDGGWALLSRLHHCIADGIALMHVLLAMTDLSPDSPWPEPSPRRRLRRGLLNRAFRAVVDPATTAVTTARQVTERLMQEGRETITHPGRVLDLAQQGTDAALTAGRLLLLPPDPATPLKGKLGVSKRAAWSRPLSLAKVKGIKNQMGATVNDVLVTAVAGGLRRYLQERDFAVDELTVRAFVPVDIRTAQQREALGNKFGLVLLDLPLHIEDALDRLAAMRRQMNQIKQSPEAVVTFGILGAMGMTPTEVQRVIVGIFGAKATAVLTNVPGPQIPLYIAGSKIKDIMFWVPQSGRLGLGVSILSYAGKVYLGVVGDTRLIPDPERILDGLYDEYEALWALVEEAEAVEAEGGEREEEEGEEEGETAVSPSPDPERCQATTQQGRQCRNRARPGSAFCHVHRGREA